MNGRQFLNNVSLGIYGDAVQRPAYRDAKVRTLLETAQQVLGPGAHAPALVVTDDAGREHRQPAVVLVSNNPYTLDQPVARGTRRELDSGKLGILLPDAPADRPHPPARAWTAAYLEVGAPAPVHAGIDGEAADLSGAVAIRAPARLTARPDLPPPPRRLTISAVCGRAATAYARGLGGAA